MNQENEAVHESDHFPLAIPRLELNVAYACNLKCEYCTHLGRMMQGIVPLDELLEWYRAWHRKISPETIRIMGGEPLLHPEIETILSATRKYWKDSKIEFVTNGILFPQASEHLFQVLRQTGTVIVVSKHFDDPHYNRMFHGIAETIWKHDLNFWVPNGDYTWMKCYKIDEWGNRRPYRSDPQKAWDICYVKQICVTLLENQLYRCPQLACYSHACRNGYVSDEWNVALQYTPLSANCSDEELQQFMTADACEQCCICPEEFEYATPYEKLSPFELPALQEMIYPGNHHDSCHERPKIKVFQYMHGDIEYFQWSEKINRLYCQRHGYEYIVSRETPRPDRHVNWHKLSTLIKELHNCDYFLCVDADAFFYSQELRIEEELIPLLGDKKIILAQDCVYESWRWNAGSPNAGVLFMKVDDEVREMFKIWDNSSEDDEYSRWNWPMEQGRFSDVILKRFGHIVEVAGDYYLMNAPHSLYIRHLMGKPDEERCETIRHYYEQRFENMK